MQLALPCRAQVEHTTPPEVVATLRARVQERVGYPALVDVVIGQRSLPADGLPGVGPVDGGHVVACHSGVTLAPLLGELVAREVCDGIEQDVLSPYRPVMDAGGRPSWR